MKVNESGRSMIEMLGVLAIIGVLSVGGIAGYSKAMSKYRVNKTVDQISHIAANTRILFSAQKDYGDLADGSQAAIITKTKLFPDELGYNEGTKKGTNAFGGEITIAPSGRFHAHTAQNPDQKAFVITYTKIPQEACIDLLTIDWGTGTAGGIISLGTDDANTGVAGQYSGKTDNTNNCTDKVDDTSKKAVACGAMSVDAAVTACSDINENTLLFKFY